MAANSHAQLQLQNVSKKAFFKKIKSHPFSLSFLKPFICFFPNLGKIAIFASQNNFLWAIKKSDREKTCGFSKVAADSGFANLLCYAWEPQASHPAMIRATIKEGIALVLTA